MWRTKFTFIWLLSAVLAVLFVVLNPARISIELAFIAVTVRQGTALVFMLACGLVAGALLRGVWVAELLRERGRLRRALKTAEARARGRIASQDVAPDHDRHGSAN